jgi:hypothetical protein
MDIGVRGIAETAVIDIKMKINVEKQTIVLFLSLRAMDYFSKINKEN